MRSIRRSCGRLRPWTIDTTLVTGSECRDDPGAAILIEPLEEALDRVWVPREAGAADLAERQYDVVLNGKLSVVEVRAEVPRLGLRGRRRGRAKVHPVVLGPG